MPTPAQPDPAVDALLEAQRRAARGGAARTVLLLHLGQQPAVQPHHWRVARAILTNAAQRLEGEVLRLANGDLALICRHHPAAPDAIGPDGAGPDGLPAVLERLFAAAAPRAPIYTRLHLPRQGDLLRDLLEPTRALPPPPPPTAHLAADPLATVASLLQVAHLPTLLRRRTAVSLARPGLMRPCLHQITLAPEALADRLAAYAQVQADPMVLRHLMAQLGQRMLDLLASRAVSATLPGPSGIALHVALALPNPLTDGFAALARACRDRGQALGVQLSFLEAAAAPDLFAAARAAITRHGARLVLSDVSAEAFLLARPDVLGAALIQLDWSPGLPRLPAAAALRAALAAADPARIILARAETEAALAWGHAQGIRIFQGRHVDAMLAAGRLGVCDHAKGCTLGQCMDRAAAAEPARRTDCRNPDLLERAAAADLLAGA